MEIQCVDRIRQEQRPALRMVGGVSVAAVLFILLAWWGMWKINVGLSPDPVRDARVAAEQAAHSEAQRLAELGPPGPALDLTAVARGQRLYAAACIACHGPEGRGVPKMGKDLVQGRFCTTNSDETLVKLIASGRTASDPLNTTGVPMPVRGGRTDFTDAHLTDIVTYLRSLQDPRRVVGVLPEVTIAVLDGDPEPTPAAAPDESVTANKSAAPVAASALDPQAVTRGKRVFASCMACHGKTGAGVPKMGADLVHSDFVKNKSDADLLAFIKKGRLPGDPDSKLKLAMPAKGGNPALKDNQLQDVIVYLRSLQQAAADAK